MKAEGRTLNDWLLKRTSTKKLTISRKIFAGRCWTWTELHLTSFRTDSTEQQLNWQLRICLQMLSVFFGPIYKNDLVKDLCMISEEFFHRNYGKWAEISRHETEWNRQGSNWQFVIWKSGFCWIFIVHSHMLGPWSLTKISLQKCDFSLQSF